MCCKKVIFVFGTRPEAIKMAPVIKAFAESDRFNAIVCLTGQHREMLYQVMDFFGIKANYDLKVMEPDQTLSSLTSKIIAGLDKIFELEKPDLILVQGDTSSVIAASLAAFYHKISVGHIEAGLRSHDRFKPFPEEINRLICSKLVDFHFAPTSQSAGNLHSENIQRHVYITGNTVIDALHLCLDTIAKKGEKTYYEFFSKVEFSRPVILLTCHRRENFGEPLRQIFAALTQFARLHPETQIVYPVHLNPNAKVLAEEMLTGYENILLMNPLDYPQLIWLMNKSYFVLTDSGGIQEEAPSLGKPVLILREVTERMEAVEAGTSKLIGTDTARILSEMKKLYTDRNYYESFTEVSNPYGDGNSSLQILNILERELN